MFATPNASSGMKQIATQLATFVALTLCAVAALAEISIEELVRDAGLREGPIAVRDMSQWNGARKILITRVGEDDVALLQAQFPDTELIVAASSADALSKAADVDAIVGACNAELVNAARQLVWVQIFSAGAERCLAVPRVASGEILLTNMQKMSAPVIGEHAVAMALALARGLVGYAKDMRSGTLFASRREATGMVSLSSKTMLVVGLGGIGTEAARRGAALGMRVIGTRNSSRNGPDFVEYVGLSDELLELVGQADVIVNALPITPATRGLLDDEFFAAAKTGAIFINVGRGATVDSDALLAALRQGKLAAAGLDVTDPEPLPEDHPLWQLKNVIITPHVSGRGGERERHKVLLRENLRRYVAGEALLNVVDPERGY